MSSKYGEVPDNNLLLNTPSIIYFWEPHAKSSSMKITPTIMINIRFSEDDPSHHDHHQEPQQDGGHPPSMWRFLTTIFP